MQWSLQNRYIKDLIEYERNPRLLTKEQASHLKRNISKFGLIDKVIINKDNTIIGGHQRLNVLKDLNHHSVECWVPSEQLSEQDVEELNISLNLHGGSWDWNKLANEWEVDFLVSIGFDPKSFFEDPDIKKSKPKITLEFQTKELLMNALYEIEQIQNKYECKIKTKV
jgi:hypothetical protein